MNLIASSHSKPSRAVLTAAKPIQRVPASQRDDRFMRGGRAMFAAFCAPTPLERLLAAARVALQLLADALRSSTDPQDTPVLTLGHHLISCRDVAPEGVTPAGTKTLGCQLRLQEICTFDPDEGPKRYAMPESREQSATMARLHWQLHPVAHAKAKRLGRDLSVKVELAGPCAITLADPAAVLAAARRRAAGAGGCGCGCGGGGGDNAGGGGAAGPAARDDEVYKLQLPNMLLLDPLADECPVAYKGDLIVTCAQTGLTAALRIAKDGSVEGTVEQAAPKAPPAAGTGGAAPVAAAAAGAAQGPRQLGMFGGSWRNQVYVSCPAMGMQGVVYDCFERGQSPNSPPGVLASVNLRRLGPMGSPKLWTAVHDAVLYCDPRAATGGKAALKLADTLASRLTALALGNADTRDTTTPGAAGAGAGDGKGGGGGGGAPDADIDAFDREFEGQGGGDDQEDRRAVPPCYKAQHAQGRKLWYTLHYALIEAEPPEPAPGSAGGRPGSAGGRPGSAGGRPGSAAGRPASAGGRPGSASAR